MGSPHRMSSHERITKLLRPHGPGHSPEIQDKLRPAKVLLFGSRADGTHSPDSDVDLIAIPPDEAAAGRTKETISSIQEGRRGVPAVSVITTTREEFDRMALLGQSFAGETARCGVTPGGMSLDCRPEREPTADEIRELTTWWLRMAESHLDLFAMYTRNRHLARSEYLGLEAQWGLERSLKGLLAASNDTGRFRRDAARMWRHVKSTQLIPSRTARESKRWKACWPPPRGPTGWDAPSAGSLWHSGETNRRRS